MTKMHVDQGTGDKIVRMANQIAHLLRVEAA